MMRTTTIRYRLVNKAEAERNRIYCIGEMEHQCPFLAVWCRQWQTEPMRAPAFWYACDAHARDMAESEGITLPDHIEPDTAWTPRRTFGGKVRQP